MTIDASVLISKSGKTFGQIKSPSMQGPNSCWFTFIPGVNRRIEIQIYRLISVGKFNGTAWVHFQFSVIIMLIVNLYNLVHESRKMHPYVTSRGRIVIIIYSYITYNCVLQFCRCIVDVSVLYQDVYLILIFTSYVDYIWNYMCQKTLIKTINHVNV